MPIICSGVALIEHVRTGDLFAVGPEDLDWQQFPAVDGEVEHRATLDHIDLGPLSWSLWEKPLGTEARRETSVGVHTLRRDLDLKLEKARGGKRAAD